MRQSQVLYFASRRAQSAIIPVEHEKSGTLSGLKCVTLQNKPRVHCFQHSLWTPVHYSHHFCTLLSPESHKVHGIVQCIANAPYGSLEKCWKVWAIKGGSRMRERRGLEKAHRKNFAN